jgi:predicted Fe-Mo cluster-binding NifX family protein
MKIAVCSADNQVSQHFGHCETFQIYTVENHAVSNKTDVPNPGHKPGFLPNFLADMGTEVVIAGGMGAGATDIFKERNIEVITGASGDADEAVNAYLRGELKTAGKVCHEHHHDKECGHDTK